VKRNLLILLSSVFILSMLSFTGCAPSKPVYEEKIISADRLIKKIEANRRKIKTFRGTGMLFVESEDLNASANFEVIFKKPDSVKVSIYGPFGITLAQSLVTDDYFEFYDAIGNKLYRGNNRDGLIEGILKINLSFDELMDAFAGSVNLSDKLSAEPTDMKIREESYLLTYADKIHYSVYDIEKENLAITSYKIYDHTRRLLLEGNYSLFREYSGVPIPKNIKIENRDSGQNLTVDYRNIEVNNDIKRLKILVPNDVKITEW